jgi:hypothetical protein
MASFPSFSSPSVLQVGIGSAFLIGGAMGTTPEGIHSYFTLISLASVLLAVSVFLPS